MSYRVVRVHAVPSGPENYLVLDIETVPDSSVWRSPDLGPGTERGNDKPFPPTYAHQVIVVGCLWLDADFKMKRLGLIGERGESEAKILEQFSEFVDEHRPCLVTYNGRTFDLPVLALRSLANGVPMAWYYDGGLRYRYSESGHIDLCDWLADHGATRASSLDARARLIGLPGKVGVDGSQIEGLYSNGKIESIENYCLADVAQTALLFLRFRLIQGILSREQYTKAVAGLTEQFRLDSRLHTLTEAIDGSRLSAA